MKQATATATATACTCGTCIPCTTLALQQASATLAVCTTVVQQQQAIAVLQQAMQLAQQAQASAAQQQIAKVQKRIAKITAFLQAQQQLLQQLQQQAGMRNTRNNTGTTGTSGINPPKSGVTAQLWDIFSANAHLTRKQQLQNAIVQGYNPATSATQYQRWLQSKTKIAPSI